MDSAPSVVAVLAFSVLISGASVVTTISWCAPAANGRTKSTVWVWPTAAVTDDRRWRSNPGASASTV